MGQILPLFIGNKACLTTAENAKAERE